MKCVTDYAILRPKDQRSRLQGLAMPRAEFAVDDEKLVLRLLYSVELLLYEVSLSNTCTISRSAVKVTKSVLCPSILHVCRHVHKNNNNNMSIYKAP